MPLRRAIFVVVSAAVALPAAARVDAVHKTGLPDSREGVKREQFLGNFDECSIKAEYSLRGDSLVKEKWGDYFFGLMLGYSPKNGGWNRWDFMQVYVRTSSGVVNALVKSRPAVFAGYSAGGADFLAAEWEVEGGRRLKLRFAVFPSHPGWLFARVDLSGADVASIGLSAYPGNAAAAEGRERHIATKERDWHLNVEAAEWRPKSPFALLYSRYVDDRFGNKLVFEPSCVDLVRVGRTSVGVNMSFTPAKGAKSAVFALGYFAHKTPDDQLTRFLGEDGDAIYDFLGSIDWEAVPDRDDFRRSVRIALSMGVEKRALNEVTRRYLAAEKDVDVGAMSACFAEVMELRRARVRAGLEELSRP